MLHKLKGVLWNNNDICNENIFNWRTTVKRNARCARNVVIFSVRTKDDAMSPTNDYDQDECRRRHPRYKRPTFLTTETVKRSQVYFEIVESVNNWRAIRVCLAYC